MAVNYTTNFVDYSRGPTNYFMRNKCSSLIVFLGVSAMVHLRGDSNE